MLSTAVFTKSSISAVSQNVFASAISSLMLYCIDTTNSLQYYSTSELSTSERSISKLRNIQTIPSSATMNRCKPVNLALHNQGLVDVMHLVDGNSDPAAQIIYNLALTGHIHSLDGKQLAETRKDGSLSHPFPSKEESPFLSDMPFFESPADLQQFQYILYKDLCHTYVGIQDMYTQEMQETRFHFRPQMRSLVQEKEAAMQLLSNIDNPMYRQPGSIIGIRSETLDRFPMNFINWEGDGMLYPTVKPPTFIRKAKTDNQPKVSYDVLSADDFSYVSPHEQYFVSPLLAGQKIWLAYPPTFGNAGKVLAEYEAVLAGKGPMMANRAPMSLELLPRLEHGVAIIQEPGQTVVMPPHWFFVKFCTRTSISCNYSITTARKFMKRFTDGNSKLFVTLASLAAVRWRDELTEYWRYAFCINKFLSEILGNTIRGFDSKTVIVDVCRDYVNLYRSWARVIALVKREEAQEFERKFVAIWTDFLTPKTKSKPECRLCHMCTADMPGDELVNIRLQQHFVDVHCDKNQ
jgi:hypothetical protein